MLSDQPWLLHQQFLVDINVWHSHVNEAVALAANRPADNLPSS